MVAAAFAVGSATAASKSEDIMMVISASRTALVFLGVVGFAACGRNGERTATEPSETFDSEPDALEKEQESDRRAVENELENTSYEREVREPTRAIGSATDAIAESRCVREERCDNIGHEKKYTTMSACVHQVKGDWRDDLNERECTGGINQVQLQECLEKIRNEDCGNPFDSLGRLAECTVNQICDTGA